ncbi:MAG: hypothetical protein ACFFD4_30560, partial [Candidatus Odinarchaeota archaeon]
MVLKRKTRTTIILLVVSISLGSFLTNQLLIEIEGFTGDVNPKDIYLFEKDYTSVYRYESGIKGAITDLTLRSKFINSTHTNVTIEYGSNFEWFLAH